MTWIFSCLRLNTTMLKTSIIIVSNILYIPSFLADRLALPIIGMLRSYVSKKKNLYLLLNHDYCTRNVRKKGSNHFSVNDIRPGILSCRVTPNIHRAGVTRKGKDVLNGTNSNTNKSLGPAMSRQYEIQREVTHNNSQRAGRKSKPHEVTPIFPADTNPSSR